MRLTNETKWLCEHARDLEKFAGKWVAFGVKEGLMSKGNTLDRVLQEAKKRKCHEPPFVFHVPSKDECRSPVPTF